MTNDISFSFAAEEIVAPGTDLVIHIARPFHKQAAQAVITLQRGGTTIPTSVSVSGDDGTVKLSTEGLSTGRYYVRIRELLDIDGNEIAQSVEIPVGIDVLHGKVPADYFVQHASRIAVGKTSLARLDSGEEAPSGHRYVEFIKAVHRTTGKPKDLAFDQHGAEVDGPKVLKEFHLRRFDEFGPLHATLHNKVEEAKDADKFDVAVWPLIKHDLTGYEKSNAGEATAPPAEAKPLLDKAIKVRRAIVDKIQKLGGDVKHTPEQALAVFVTLTAAQVKELAKDTTVGKIFFDDSSSVPDLANSEAIAYAPGAQALGFTGRGVHVAVFEAGPADLTNLSFAGRYQPNPVVGDPHSRLTSAIIKNVEPSKPHGYAPDCDLYSANTFGNDALLWAVASPQYCTVVSQSFHRDEEQRQDFLSSDDILKDHLATTYPYPTIVHAAGNGAATEYVNHKGYNTLSIGSHDDTAAAMAGDSVFRNPASSHGDRELPELAANGTGVTAVGVTMWGTSFAAPAVAGTAALIQSANATLKSWPEGCRAILLASADRSISGGTWGQDLVARKDASDGAGALNAQNAVLIAQSQSARNNSPALVRGWNVGSLVPADFDATTRLSTFRYKVQVPSSPLTLLRYTVKVALAWDSKVTLNAAGTATASTLTNDLDLAVYNQNGVQVAASSSNDNSYEIVEFEGVKGAVYDVAIRSWTWPWPAGITFLWYGVSWNVVGKLPQLSTPVSFPPAGLHEEL